VNIEAAQGLICEGKPVTFKAIPTNGGNNPTYQWVLNGNNVGTNAPDYTLASAVDGGQVKCMMTASKNCLIANPVQSNVITLGVTPAETAAITITASKDSTFCKGTEVFFTATASQTGSTPVYEWRVNGNPVGSDSPVFSTKNLEDQDVIVCYLTSSLPCLTKNPVVSNEVVASVDNCTVGAGDIKHELAWQVYPNPANGKIFVEILEPTDKFALHLLNTKGQLAYTITEEHPAFPHKRTLDVTGFPKGIYFLQIITNQSLTIKKVALQ
jgi:hypothetical protein